MFKPFEMIQLIFKIAAFLTKQLRCVERQYNLLPSAYFHLFQHRDKSDQLIEDAFKEI